MGDALVSGSCRVNSETWEFLFVFFTELLKSK